MTKLLLLRALIATTLVWCVALPFVWAWKLAAFLDLEYTDALRLYLPEIGCGVLSVPFLVGAWGHRGWAVGGLATVAVLAPILHFAIGSPSKGAWVVSVSFLGAVGWLVHATRKQHDSR